MLHTMTILACPRPPHTPPAPRLPRCCPQMPLLEQIHSFMVKANDAGSISRQEAVSMVPPLFLDVRPMHKVRRLCTPCSAGMVGAGLCTPRRVDRPRGEGIAR